MRSPSLLFGGDLIPEVSFDARRKRGGAHGVRFGEISHWEVVLVDKL
jgi:hypothetical protein